MCPKNHYDKIWRQSKAVFFIPLVGERFYILPFLHATHTLKTNKMIEKGDQMFYLLVGQMKQINLHSRNPLKNNAVLLPKEHKFRFQYYSCLGAQPEFQLSSLFAFFEVAEQRRWLKFRRNISSTTFSLFGWTRIVPGVISCSSSPNLRKYKYLRLNFNEIVFFRR